MTNQKNVQERSFEPLRVSFSTLGCRLNLSESSDIEQGFRERGHHVVPFTDEADLSFINTCTVTDDADSTCRRLIRQAHRTSPEGRIVVAGCYAQMEPEKVAQMQGVDLVLGTQEKFKVFDYLQDAEQEKIKIDQTDEFWGAHTGEGEGRTRAFLKIQDGCNYICSFCIIPKARGRSRTISPDEAIVRAKDIIQSGRKEIVLTGVNIGEYEKTSGIGLHTLVESILKIEGLEGLRLSSLEPNTITDELLGVLADSPLFLPHFHLPLQSASDSILSAMRRKYTASFYEDLIHKILTIFPRATFGADVICGHPGESEEDFNKTYDYLKRSPLTHFHVFPYSKRKGTTAAKRDDHIHEGVKKERVQILRTLGSEKKEKLAKSLVGSSLDVLFEKRTKEGLNQGLCPQFLKVRVQDSRDLKNTRHRVKITQTHGEILFGRIL